MACRTTRRFLFRAQQTPLPSVRSRRKSSRRERDCRRNTEKTVATRANFYNGNPNTVLNERPIRSLSNGAASTRFAVDLWRSGLRRLLQTASATRIVPQPVPNHNPAGSTRHSKSPRSTTLLAPVPRPPLLLFRLSFRLSRRRVHLHLHVPDARLILLKND